MSHPFKHDRLCHREPKTKQSRFSIPEQILYTARYDFREDKLPSSWKNSFCQAFVL